MAVEEQCDAMKKQIIRWLLLTGTLCASAQTVLLNNDFTDGTLANWVAESGMSVAIMDDAGGIGGGNALLITSSSGNRRSTTLLNRAVTLGVDDTLTVTADYRYLNGPTTANSSLEIRFKDSVSGKYMGFALNPSSSASHTLIFGRTGDSNEGKVNSFDHGTAAQSMTFTVSQVLDGTNPEANFDVAWVGGPTYTGKGGTSTVLDPASEFRFDTFSIGVTGGDTTDGLLFDNINITTTASLTEAPAFELDAASSSFQFVPGVQTNLPLVIRNTGFDATNVTATLSTTSSWFSVLTAPIDTAALAGNGGEMTNTFSVSVATNAPAGVYANALALEIVGYGPDGSGSTSSVPVSLEVVSTNTPSTGITHAHDDPRFDYDGVLFPKHTNDYVQLNRFSDPILAASEGFNADRAIVPSCVVIRFTTASPTITAHFTTIPTDKDLKMPQYAVYRNGTTNIADYEEFKFVGGTTNPVFTFETETPGSNVMYEILLPSLNATAFQGLTLDSGYDLVTNAPYERPVFVAIGDSITMNAGFQSMSYETYTWKFGRARGMEIYNIAVGGAKTAPDWGSMFPSLDPEFITVLFGINDWNTGNDPTLFRSKYTELLDNIRADHADTPLFCITLVAINDKVDPVGSEGVTVNAFRREIIDMVNERRAAGDSNIYLIAGHSMTDSDDLLDSFHFDRAGTSKFATNLNAAIDEILVHSNYTGIAAIPTNTYSDWAADYSLNASVTNRLNDADLDGLNNLTEFALGGNPTNGLRDVRMPAMQSGGGVEYIYQRRQNAAAHGLRYTPLAVSNLTDTAWSTNGITETGANSVDSDFESVTNRVDLGNQGFVRLTVEETP